MRRSEAGFAVGFDYRRTLGAKSQVFCRPARRGVRLDSRADTPGTYRRRVQRFADLRHTGRRILTSDIVGAIAGVRVGEILHPAVLLAFADAPASYSTEIAQPQRPDRRLLCVVISIEIAPLGQMISAVRA